MPEVEILDLLLLGRLAAPISISISISILLVLGLRSNRRISLDSSPGFPSGHVPWAARASGR